MMPKLAYRTGALFYGIWGLLHIAIGAIIGFLLGMMVKHDWKGSPF